MTQKKLMFSLLVAMIMTACTACDPINPPDPPVKKYTITATASDGGSISPSSVIVESGKSTTFNIIASDGYTVDAVKVDGIVLFSTSVASYTLSNVTSDHKIEVTFKVKDGSPLSYLTSGPWYQCYFLYSLENGNWSEEMKDPTIIKMIFYLNKSYELYWDDKLSGNGPWSLNTKITPMTFNLSNAVFKIEKLTSDSLIYTQESFNVDGSKNLVKFFDSHVKN